MILDCRICGGPCIKGLVMISTRLPVPDITSLPVVSYRGFEVSEFRGCFCACEKCRAYFSLFYFLAAFATALLNNASFCSLVLVIGERSLVPSIRSVSSSIISRRLIGEES
jgi:hypothetical protein